MNNSAGPSFLRDFAKAILLTTPISPLAAWKSNEAEEARKDQSGFLPESGLSEGYAAITPSKHFVPAVSKAVLAPTGIPLFAGLFSKAAQEARKDQSGVWPEIGLSEAFQVSNPNYDYNNATISTQPNTSNNKGNFFTNLLGIGKNNALGQVDWLAATANSPAAQAGFTPEQRWALQQQTRDFRGAQKAGALDEFVKKYPQSQTAKERAISNRIPTSMDMEF